MSVPLGIGLCWVLPFWNLDMWLCWNMRGIGGEVFFSPFYGIAGVSPEYCRKFASCLALSCLVAAAATATAAGSAGPDAAVAAAVGAEQGDSLMRLLGTCQSWPGFAPSPWAYGPQAVPGTGGLSVCLDCIRPCTCIFGWSLHFDCSCGETCVPLRFSTKSFKIT